MPVARRHQRQTSIPKRLSPEVMSGLVPASFMIPIHCSTGCDGGAAITGTCRNTKHCEQDDQTDSYPFLDVEEDVAGSLLAFGNAPPPLFIINWLSLLLLPAQSSSFRQCKRITGGASGALHKKAYSTCFRVMELGIQEESG